MSLSRLAVVELQLILHWLDLRSRLALARCSRLTITAASSPHAWKHVALLLKEPLVKSIDLARASTLLRHCELEVIFPNGSDAENEALAALDSLPHVQTLISLDAREADMWSRLLQLPSMRSLRALVFGAEALCDAHVGQLVVMHAPQLERIMLEVVDLSAPEQYEQLQALLDLLPRFARLEHLRIDVWHSGLDDAEQVALSIPECPSLRSVHFAHFSRDMIVPLLLQSPAMRLVRDLRLSYISALPTTLDPDQRVPDWTRALSNLFAVRTLRLACMDGISAMLDLITPAVMPALETLHVECDGSGALLPSIESLQRVLDCNSPKTQLHLMYTERSYDGEEWPALCQALQANEPIGRMRVTCGCLHSTYM